ncbi:MAG: ComF family protein, partial [Gemmatimonadetes bacterium]|nr:ComF family protein [Gemmatimonadota bacterium]
RAHVRAAADLIWLPRCPACNRRAENAPDQFCAACWSALRPLRPGGEPLATGAPEPLAAYSVDPLFIQMLGAAKYQGYRTVLCRLARGAASLLGERLSASGLPPGTLVPVPLAPAKRRERGFNQAEVFAAELAAVFARDLRPWLVRRRSGPALARLSRDEREAAVAGSYAAAAEFPGPAAGPVLLVDDVVTTGSTAAAARRALGGDHGPVTHIVAMGRAFATVADNLPPTPKILERL